MSKTSNPQIEELESPDPYSNIYQYATDYRSALKDLNEGVGTKYPQHETLSVIIKTSDLTDIIADSEYMGAIIGIEKGSLTVSFVGVDVSFSGTTIVGARVRDKYVNGSVMGQEVWPKIAIEKFDDLLPPPRKKKK